MDKQKADQIITEYLKKIYGFAVKKSFSYDEAEELCSQIIHEVYLSLLHAEEIVNIEGYIWRISEHSYSKYVSTKKKHEGISIDGMQIPFCDDYAFGDAEDELRQLRREIAFLTERRRQIVYRFYYQDRSVSAISREMSIPEGTVKWHLNKARIELKEGFSMERKIGKLGLSPITTTKFGHNGNPGLNGGPEYYLADKLSLNIVYSVYWSAKTREEIAEELGVTPVYLDDKLHLLEDNGFLVKTHGDRYTTYVAFDPEQYSIELNEKKRKIQLQIAQKLVQEYVPLVRKAVQQLTDVYIPGGNRELLEAAAVFYGVSCKCNLSIAKDLSRYIIKTTDGGEYMAFVNLDSQPSDPDYVPTLDLPSYWICGSMTRGSDKYPSVFSWSVDSRYSSRKGAWKNNLYSDYEYLYEFMNGMIVDNAANAEKFSRLREREFVTADNRVNIMVAKGTFDDFCAQIPELSEEIKAQFAQQALEFAMAEAKLYPPQMQDYVVNSGVAGFVGNTVALMVLDILYQDGVFQPLTENEKVTTNLLMFSDTLPQEK